MRLEALLKHFSWVLPSIFWAVLGLTLPSVSEAALSCEGLFSPRSSFTAKIERIGMTRSLLAETESFARESIKRYPPDKFYLVNFGPSTTLLSSFIRALAPGVHYVGDVPVLQGGGVSRLSPEERSLWMKRVLPDLSSLGGREIVVNRVMWLGGQMSTFAPMFYEYVRDHRMAPRVHFNVVIGFGGADLSHPVSEKTSMMAWTELTTGNSLWHYTSNVSLASASVYDRNRRMADDFHEMSLVKPFYVRDALADGFSLAHQSSSRKLDALVAEFLRHP